MLKAIFLDRDGVIIWERGDYNYREEHIRFIDGIVESLRRLSQRKYQLIVISNQGGIAKGLYSQQDVEKIHKIIKEFFAKQMVLIKDFYYCPHHQSIYKCLCKKPDSLLLEKAMAYHDISAKRSYFIGDKQTDLEAGRKAGIPTILIPPNASLLNYLQLIK